MMLAVLSCSEEFLKDNIEQTEIVTGDFEIIVSPLWDADDYQFSCRGTYNTDFTVKSTPKWLEMETTTGKLTAMQTDDVASYQQSMGTIRCKAKLNPDFAKTGLYLDKIEISVDGKICYVPVMYISEGNPKIEVNDTLSIGYINKGYYSLEIKNINNGILLWDIASMPEWLAVNTNELMFSSDKIIRSGYSYRLPLILDNDLLTENLTGNIILKTNDKSNPEVTIKVNVDFGRPKLYIDSDVLYFWEIETSRNFRLSNSGNGILMWNFSEMPEWLSVSKSSGVLYSSEWENVTFICDRSLVPEEISEITIYLNLNDAANSKVKITVYLR